MKNKYFVFAYDCYYPGGGMNDFEGNFETIEEAKKYCETHKDNYEMTILERNDFVKIYDITTQELVFEYKRNEYEDDNEND